MRREEQKMKERIEEEDQKVGEGTNRGRGKLERVKERKGEWRRNEGKEKVIKRMQEERKEK